MLPAAGDGRAHRPAPLPGRAAGHRRRPDPRLLAPDARASPNRTTSGWRSRPAHDHRRRPGQPGGLPRGPARGARSQAAQRLRADRDDDHLDPLRRHARSWSPRQPFRSSVPVGKPLPHAQVLVLDEDLNRVPAGEVGEIYIGGCGVARGYLGRPDLTAELFLPNPHGAAPGSRMYRTGDLGRWRADHHLEVIGRVDHQVKIRGFRVEPAEIEGALTSHPGIAEAVVIAHEFGPGNRQLAAYYRPRRAGRPGRTARPSADLPSDASLRSFLAARVPSFMIPAAFIAMDQMPLTPAGKVDRRALPPPVTAASGSRDGEYTPVQAGMSHLWSGLLKTGPDKPRRRFLRPGRQLTAGRGDAGARARDVRHRRGLCPPADPLPAARRDAAGLLERHA